MEGIEQQFVNGGASYLLQPRPLGKLKLIPVIMLLVAAGISIGPARALASGGNTPSMIFGVMFLLMPLALVLMALAMLKGRTEIELRDDRLTAVERLGPLGLFRRTRTGAATGLKVHHAGNLAGLAAEYDDRPPMILAVGYPASWLMPLAETLRGNLGVEVSVVEHQPGETHTAPRHEDYRPRPDDALATLDRNADGITITVPPTGVRKGSKGLFAFGVIWTVMTLAITVPMTLKSSGSDVIGILLFMTLFLAIGVGMLVGGLNMGKRHAIIDVVGDVLLVNRKNLFGLKSHQWTREELQTVTVGPSGMEVNDRPVLHMKVRPKEGKAIGMFTGRDVEELRWIASEIRVALWGS